MTWAAYNSDGMPLAQVQGVVELELNKGTAPSKTHQKPKIHYCTLISSLFLWFTFIPFCVIANDAATICFLTAASFYFIMNVIVEVVLVTCKKSGILFYILYSVNEESGSAAMDQMRQSPPQLKFKMRSYHVHHGNNGPEDKATWKGEIDLSFQHSSDNSAPLPALTGEGRSVQLVTIKKRYSCADEETKKDLEKQRSVFIKANKNRDKRYKVKEKLYLDGQVKHLAIVSDGKGRPMWFSLGGYTLSVLLGLVFVYRTFAEMYVYDRVEWVCEKVVSMQPIDIRRAEYTDHVEALNASLRSV